MFNSNSKAKNILLSSSFGVVEQFLSYLMAFLFRTVLIYTLSMEYLGISGLFTNVLQVFSLAELGIGSVISYRMYEPIKAGDQEKCAELLLFYRNIYAGIALLVSVLGLVFYPFLPYLIKDTSEIPVDINLNIVYILFVAQSVLSYLCVYMQSLLAADQKGYIVSIANSLSTILMNLIRIVLLRATRNYTLVLAVGIGFGIVFNFAFSIYIRHAYRKIIWSRKSVLSSAEKKEIVKDTMALLCHKIGYTVVNSTDSLILSRFIGIRVLGIYSNYSLISAAIDAFLNKVFGSFVSTIGNMSIGTPANKKYERYKNFRFLNMWAASFCAVSMFILTNPFLELIFGRDSLLDLPTVMVLTTNLFFNSSRIINTAYVNANGLFVKDKIRPLIQATLNLVISIALVIKIGISGVFIGTIASMMLTVWWREGIILYRHVFSEKVWEYYINYLKWTILTLAFSTVAYGLCRQIPVTVLGFLLRIFICMVGVNTGFALIFQKNENFLYVVGFLHNYFNGKKTDQ